MPRGIRYIDIHTHTRKPGVLCMVSYGLGRDVVPPEPARPFTAGIHPWDAAVLTDDRRTEYLAYLRTAPVAAVGEAGLDRLKGGDLNIQSEVFRAQVEVAAAQELPVIAHCVRAYNELFAIVEKYPDVRFILHGYTGSPEQTRRALELGCRLSIGPRSLGSPKTVESIAGIPAERLFAETDDSGADIAAVYSRLAQIKNMQLPDLAATIEINFNRIFSNNV